MKHYFITLWTFFFECWCNGLLKCVPFTYKKKNRYTFNSLLAKFDFWHIRLLVASFPFPNPLSTRPHQNVVWYNNLIRFSKNSELCTKRKRKIYCKKMRGSFVTVKWLRWLIGIILGEIICKSSKLATHTKIEDHYFRWKLTTF